VLRVIYVPLINFIHSRLVSANNKGCSVVNNAFKKIIMLQTGLNTYTFILSIKL
jgi:hypothetical protein